MNRRELFATLGAVLGAAIGRKVAGQQLKTKTPVISGVIEFGEKGEQGLIYTNGQITLIRGNTITSGAINMESLMSPIADIANRPEDAKRIFEFVANTSCQYTGVSYVEFNDPTVIISGDCGTSKSSVLITPTSIRYRTITNRGQEVIHDAKTQKVIDFIRTLGYDFE